MFRDELLLSPTIPQPLLEKSIQITSAIVKGNDAVILINWNSLLFEAKVEIEIFAGRKRGIEKRILQVQQRSFHRNVTGGEHLDCIKLLAWFVENRVVIVKPGFWFYYYDAIF